MKKVYSATHPVNAHLVKGILEGENIKCIVQGEYLWNVRGEIPLTPDTCPSVWVILDDDYDRAMEVIRKFQVEGSRCDLNTKEWRCSKCGESNEGQFSECWKCGAPRTSD
jgi:hypothetical protein